ncbi:hypothetical protein KC345_g8005 [Hortaea werneckii]|nr:hypothetical protein KC345_g8005 [Hortaea werneckii]
MSVMTGDDRDYACPAGVERLGVPCRTLKHRYYAVPVEPWDEVMPGSYAEFPYGPLFTARLRQHEAQVKSKHLMNSSEATCKVKLGVEFGFERFIIYHIQSFGPVELSEMHWTRADHGHSNSRTETDAIMLPLGQARLLASASALRNTRGSGNALNLNLPLMERNLDPLQALYKQQVADYKAEAAAYRAEADDLTSLDKYHKKGELAQSLLDRRLRTTYDLSNARDGIDRRITEFLDAQDDIGRCIKELKASTEKKILALTFNSRRGSVIVALGKSFRASVATLRWS